LLEPHGITSKKTAFFNLEPGREKGTVSASVCTTVTIIPYSIPGDAQIWEELVNEVGRYETKEDSTPLIPYVIHVPLVTTRRKLIV
jgi:hypothetical protein